MRLINLIDSLPIRPQPGQRWSLIGPDVGRLAKKFGLNNAELVSLSRKTAPTLHGVLLFEALSTQPQPQTWLIETIDLLPSGATLLVIDWQDDGPLNYGPELERRFKKGRLQRLLRDQGFGAVQTLDNHPVYYVVQAIKGPPPPPPHAGQFVDVAGLDELPRNAMKAVDLFGHKIVVANTGKEIVAFARTCPHADGLLDKGLLRGRNVACPLHGYIWNVCTGQPVQPDDEDILPRYAIRVNSDTGQICVALDSLGTSDVE